MPLTIANGAKREIAGDARIFFEGYWIKYYEPPPNTLETKRQLIQALTRRLFNHVEHGINIPGSRLEVARAAYEAETDPQRKRVNGAMLAGALFNRATDIFNCLVDLQANGVEIAPDNSLMRDCGQYLLEALDLGKLVRHRSGQEGIDELWGEPFKVFSMPIADFYYSRYLKIALAMRELDRIAVALKDSFAASRQIPDIAVRVDDLIEAAKRKCEILRTDPVVFDVWPAFSVACDRLRDLEPQIAPGFDPDAIHEALESIRLLREGTELVSSIARARVPMPKSTREYIDHCVQFKRSFFGSEAS